MDHFGLAELLEKAELPSVEALRRALDHVPEALPRSVSSDFISRSILSDLVDQTNAELEARSFLTPRDAVVLARMSPGRRTAGRYHDFMYRVLPEVFRGWLSNPKKEQPLSGKIKFIDIVFDNVAIEGFFSELVLQHRLKAGYVVIECKNYFDDPGSPEFDQLAGRLGGGVGQFGILTCRTVVDQERALAYQKDALKRGLRILLLVDEDISKLVVYRFESNLEAISDLLRVKLRQLNFG